MANAAFLVEGYVGARLDRTLSFISELGARGEPAAGFFRLSDLVAGVLLFAGGFAAFVLLPRNVALRAGVAASMAFAVLTALDAFLPLECVPTVDPACRAAEDAGDVGWQHRAHNVTGVLEGFLAPAALLLIAIGVWQLQRRGTLPAEWDGVWQTLVVIGVVSASMSVIISLMYLDRVDGVGLYQRVQIVMYATAMFTMGLAIRNYRRPVAVPT